MLKPPQERVALTDNYLSIKFSELQLAIIQGILAMTNLHFKDVLSNILIASTDTNITVTNRFNNITGLELLAKLSVPQIGAKFGSHYLRTSLKTDINRKCLPRNNTNLNPESNLIVIDCDKRINELGEIIDSAPNPFEIIKALQKHDIGFVLHGTHSHYSNTGKGNRYRILILTSNPYKKEQLEPTIQSVIDLINNSLKSDLLHNSTENNTYAQPFFYPRMPVNCNKLILYAENLNGRTIEVCDPQIISIEPNKPRTLKKPAITNSAQNSNYSYSISPIQAFNQQYPLPELLTHYRYKKVFSTHEYEKWISPESTSGIPGITVWKTHFYSHHADIFNDGKAKDSFDLFRIRERLNKREAIIKASKMTIAPDGSSVETWNYRAWRKSKSQQD